MKNVLIMSDPHCGHWCGLTPPQWLLPDNDKTSKFFKLQKILWEWFLEERKKIGKIDILIINGDTIDGKGKRSGGTELISSDMLTQCDIAEYMINRIKAKKIFMTYGTPYHTGEGEDFEDIIAERVGADISGHHFIDVNGVVFDVKHKTGSSAIPHGRHTAIARDALWNDVWSMDENNQPKADVIIRSHVHYFGYGGTSRKLYMTTPALQTFGSKFGIRQCSGVVDVGFIHFQISENGDYTWQPHLLKHQLLKARVLKA